MFKDTFCTIQVPNVAFYAEYNFKRHNNTYAQIKFTHALFNLLTS